MYVLKPAKEPSPRSLFPPVNAIILNSPSSAFGRDGRECARQHAANQRFYLTPPGTGEKRGTWPRELPGQKSDTIRWGRRWARPGGGGTAGASRALGLRAGAPLPGGEAVLSRGGWEGGGGSGVTRLLEAGWGGGGVAWAFSYPPNSTPKEKKESWREAERRAAIPISSPRRRGRDGAAAGRERARDEAGQSQSTGPGLSGAAEPGGRRPLPSAPRPSPPSQARRGRGGPALPAPRGLAAADSAGAVGVGVGRGFPAGESSPGAGGGGGGGDGEPGMED